MSPIDRELQSALGELVLLKTAGDKEALFKALGTGADWLFGKGLRAARPVVAPLARGAAKLPGKAYNVAMEAGGVRGISKEQKLLQLMKARQGMGPAWDTVRDLAKSKGLKNPVTAFRAFFNPMQSLTPRVSEGGYARWLLNELKDPIKRQQFLVGATPAQVAAVQKLTPYFAQAHRAGEASLAGKLAPLAIIGGPVAYNLAKGDKQGERPVVTSPRSGLPPGLSREPQEPNMLEKFWGDAGGQVSKLSPGIGGFMAQHPYLSTAGAAGLMGAGLYGLFGGRKDEQ